MQGRPAYYEAYATLLASWGIAVLQYDLPGCPILPLSDSPCPTFQNMAHEVRIYILPLQMTCPLTRRTDHCRHASGGVAGECTSWRASMGTKWCRVGSGRPSHRSMGQGVSCWP